MIMKVGHVLDRVQQTRSAFGWKAAVESWTDRVGDSTISLQVIEVVWLQQSAVAELSDADPRFEFRFLEAEEVRHFSANPELKLSPELADRIEAGYDSCFAALEGEKLAAYGWYAFDCIEGEHNFGVPMSFPAEMAYMYNGFTHPEYRGLRLHGRVMGLALKTLKQWGITHLVSTVDWTNQASLRSCDRLGYHRLGRIVTVGRMQPMVLRSPSQAASLGVQFGHQARQRSESAHPPAVVRRLPASESVRSVSSANVR